MTDRPLRSRSTSRGENSGPSAGSSSRWSTTSTRGQPARSLDRSSVMSSPHASASRVGQGDTRRHGTPARRARSIATSLACQVGACSCWYTSSCSSRTITRARFGAGAQAAARAPTTTRARPDAALVHSPAAAAPGPSAATIAVGTASRRSRRPRMRASATDGQSTSTCPPLIPAAWPACRSSGYRSAPGANRRTPRSAISAGATTASPQVTVRPSPFGATGRERTTPGGAAVRRNEARRPTHRSAAHAASSISSGAGPRPDTLASGLSATPATGSTSTATIQAPTRRPWSWIRTTSPTWTSTPSGTR